MQGVVKKVLIAVVLVVVSVAVLAATKAYGVWVISGIAVVLFVLGLLRKEPRSGGEEKADKGAGKTRSEGQERQDSHEA